MRTRSRRAAIILLGLIILAAAALLAARRLFDEPDATSVTSLTARIGAERVLALFAHPDDEMLVTEVIRQAEKEEAYTAIVTATRGERGDQMPVVARQRDLAVVRHAEVLKHGFALGIDAHEVWTLPDRGLNDLALSTLVDSLVGAIRRHRPDLVITFWPGSGISTHPDHMAVGAAVEEAVRRLQGSDVVDGVPRWIAYPLLPQRALRRFGGERGRTVAGNQPAPTHYRPDRRRHQAPRLEDPRLATGLYP